MSSEMVGVMGRLGVRGAKVGGVAGGGMGSGGGESGADIFSGVSNVSSSELESRCSRLRGTGASSILSERLVFDGDGGNGAINGIGEEIMGVGVGKESGDVVDMVRVQIVICGRGEMSL